MSVIQLLLILATFAQGDERSAKKAEAVKRHLKRLQRQRAAVRLVNGRSEYEGNVEVHYNGKWGAVCDDEWDLIDANVTCKSLGYTMAIEATHNSHYGSTKRRIWMDNVQCQGGEDGLKDCRFDGWGVHDCQETEGAGVVCNEDFIDEKDHPKQEQVHTKVKIGKEGWKIRLRGGRVPEEGRVEIQLNNLEWGLICGDGWSLLEGNVVCRQLGLGWAAAAVQSDFFGGNESQLALSGVQCRGEEAALGLCQGHEQLYCPGIKSRFAGVVCSTKMPDLVLDNDEIMRTAHLEDRQLFFLQCAMEENCLASAAYELRKTDPHGWHLETRRLLRFTLSALNIGNDDFRPFVPKHLWEWHACHMHFHSMEVFATFNIVNQKGERVAEGHKASFCLEDNTCLAGVEPKYACANYGDQGVSVNCSDIYKYNIDCQWVDITELKPGFYTFHVTINPEFKIGEMTFENNGAACDMIYTETFVAIQNCSHQRP